MNRPQDNFQLREAMARRFSSDVLSLVQTSSKRDLDKISKDIDKMGKRRSLKALQRFARRIRSVTTLALVSRSRNSLLIYQLSDVGVDHLVGLSAAER
ncbi:hypothetical protein [Aliiruegeria lutimaris]|uniref:Uncharacterized protein n=1 Tax=Aliiruegeria lutimaris TaxID=571298 RepID=A0A1G8KJ18_9RHOB|nr:hypothetical protein [Aliiruegeria lutimaris]SDI43402.1 hypothetical protein SAMN04488026_10034 [Aliiruegeria lutimaris]